MEPLLSPILASIINNSFYSGKFPNSLKLAKVIPIFKAGDRQNVSNYRPISILPLLSKIFEKIVFTQILNFLEKYNLLSNNQYGFRPKRSTTQAMLDNLQFIYNNLDSNHVVLSIFLDFSKAFDCIDHELLLSKLGKYGFRGVSNDWFKSYLSDRKQYVYINETDSDLKSVTHGVPQGSILGPILFLIFINDFPDSTDFFKFTLFADDSSLLCKFDHSNISLIHTTISSNLTKVFKWLTLNKIKVNVDKCKFIIFSYGRKLTLPPLVLGDGFIMETDSYKFLGIILDKKLNFKNHLVLLKSKISKTVGLLYKLNKFLPETILKSLYQTLVQPYLTYGIEAWFSAPNCLTDKIFVLQKKSIRAILNLHFNCHTNQYFKYLNLLKLSDLYKVNLMVFFYSSLNLGMNRNVSVYMQTHADTHSHNTRNRNKLKIPLAHKAHTQRSFLHRGINEWNSLPEIITKSSSTIILRKNLKTLYLSCY